MASFLDKLRALASEEGSLKSRAFKTAGWVFVGQGAQRGLSLLSSLIMTRLLAPEAFGLMAMVFTVHMLVNMISDIGIRQSIVRAKKGDDIAFLQVAWTVQVMRAALVALVVLAAAGGLMLLGPRLAAPESVYADPLLPGLVAASALIVLFRGLESVGVHLASRRMKQRRVATLNISSQILNIALMVGFAQIEASAWAILWGTLIGSGVRMLRTHMIFSETPMKFRWDKETADELWRFGRWLVGASLFGFVLNNGDRFILGALLDKTAFGVYTIAALWIQMGLGVVNQISDQVVNAALAETVRKNPDRAPQVLKRLRRGVDAMCLAGFFGATLLGPPLLGALYSQEYAMAGAFMALLSFRFLARRQNALGGVLLTMGRSDLMMYNIAVAAVALVAGALILDALLGLEYAVLAIALAPFAGAPIMVRNARRVMPGIDVRLDWIVMIATPLLAVALVASGVLSLPQAAAP